MQSYHTEMSNNPMMTILSYNAKDNRQEKTYTSGF